MFPEFFKIGDLTIYSYGVMYATAFLTGLFIAYRIARRVGLSPQMIIDVSIVILIGAVLGAKLFYFFGHLPEMLASPENLMGLIRAGGVFQGGLITAVVLAVGYLLWKKQPVWLVADVMAPSVALGQAIGRIGCFAAGCCYGKVVDGPGELPWAVIFGPEAIAPAGLWRHPTQLYESALLFLVFVILVVLWRYRKFDGQIFWVYVLLHSAERGGIVEWWRGDHNAVFLGLTGQQLIAALTFAASIAALFILRRFGKLTINAAEVDRS